MYEMRNTVSARAKKLAEYSYGLLRLVELESAWAAIVPESATKIALGRAIGHCALGLGKLSGRFEELAPGSAVPRAPESYARNFVDACVLTTSANVTSFAVAILGDLQRSMRAVLADQADVRDEPTGSCLAAAVADLEAARRALQEAGGGERAIRGLDDGGAEATTAYDGHERLPPLVDSPARDPALSRSCTPIIAGMTVEDRLESARGMSKLFYFMYADVEIPAVEICARNIVAYRDMPLAFKLDMARQAWDEARHAVVAGVLASKHGAPEGFYPYTSLVWDRYAAGRDLCEQLAIEQVVQEGNSLDKVIETTREMREFGWWEEADAMDWIIADEILHVSIGNRWLRYLCQGSRDRYAAAVARADEVVRVPPGPVNETVRRQAGFEDWYLDHLRQCGPA